MYAVAIVACGLTEYCKWPRWDPRWKSIICRDFRIDLSA